MMKARVVAPLGLMVVIAFIWLASQVGQAHTLPDYHGDPARPGSVVKVEAVGSYPAAVMRLLVWTAKLPDPVAINRNVRLYRVTYWSRINAMPVLVSGLMSLPDKGQLRGAVLWMHGTNVDRAASVSQPSFQVGVLGSGIFAGGGYLYLAPDLVGLGVSKQPQAYLYNQSTIDTTLDFLIAAQTVSRDLGRSWNPSIYVTGFSQGGQATAVVARELERRGDPRWRLTAAAAIAGAYNLADFSLPMAMKGKSPGDPIYLTNMAISYATYYGHPLNSVMTTEAARRAEILFDGNHEKDIAGQMPANPRTLFRADFLEALDKAKPHWFLDAARANEAYDWAPKAPFRAYYGDLDVDVYPDDSRRFAEHARRLGGHAEAISVGRYDHFGSVIQAVPKVRAWFDALVTSSEPAA
jgi:pimeloyl-ACP methyl ester carboxylesterase